MAAVAQATTNEITLRGSTAIVAEFFGYSINSILYQRGIYPPDQFVHKQQYGLSMLVTQDQDLKDYLDKVLTQLARTYRGGGEGEARREEARREEWREERREENSRRADGWRVVGKERRKVLSQLWVGGGDGEWEGVLCVLCSVRVILCFMHHAFCACSSPCCCISCCEVPLPLLPWLPCSTARMCMCSLALMTV